MSVYRMEAFGKSSAVTTGTKEKELSSDCSCGLNHTDLYEDVRIFHTRDLLDLQLNSTSKGNQRKWYCEDDNIWIKEQFYYQDKYWKDYLVEMIAYQIASQMDLHGINVPEQKECIIVDDYTGKTTHGVYSFDFRANNEFVSFNRIIQNLGLEFPSSNNVGVAEKWNFVLDVLNKVTKSNCIHYLNVMAILDYLVGNEDRHLNNFGMMSDYSIAPLFDFGLGLFEHDHKYSDLYFRDCIKQMNSKPFHRDNQRVIEFLSAKNNISDYLPNTINLGNLKLPSVKAKLYLQASCTALHVKLKGGVL